MSDVEFRSSRDTRLLALVIVIALGVLFVLAQLRFPATDARVTPVASGPLERLAATGVYDDLAMAVRTALDRAAASILVIDLQPENGQGSPDGRRTLAVRLRPDAAAAHMPPSFALNNQIHGAAITVRSLDKARDVAVLALPAGEISQVAATPVESFAGFAYVAVLEPASGGPTAKPVFVGRVDTTPDPRWGTVWACGGATDLPIGGLVFLLDGRFVGMVVGLPGGARAIAPSAAFDALFGSAGRPIGVGP